jgi:hypothetical protein
MCRNLPITRAVQQVAAKTRITTRRNILTPDLLASVWPRYWVHLMWSGGIFTNLHVLRHLIRDYSCGACLTICQVLDYWILSPRTFPVSYDLHDCTSHLLAVCNMSVTAWVLIKVKVSLTIHDDSDVGWNVWRSALLWHSAQFWLQSCQLYACASLYSHENYLGFFSVRGWMDPKDSELANLKIFLTINVPRHRTPPESWCGVLYSSGTIIYSWQRNDNRW